MNAAERERVLAALQLGLGRQTLHAEWAKHPLAALAVAGQSLRFAAPAALPPDAIQETSLPANPAPALPDSGRIALLRLSARLDATSIHAIAPLLLAQLRATGHRLHPFDLPHLTALLAASRDTLGPVERAWMTRNTGEAVPVSSDTWRDGTPTERLRFLHDLRRADPAAARAMLEDTFPADPAKARADLLGALVVRLGPDDVPFLAACAADRSAPVRQAAEALLARLPGSASHAARLQAARDAVKVRRDGLRPMLAYEPPVRQGRPAPPREVLAGLGLGALAATLGVATEALAAMDADDALRHALAGCALVDGDEALALRLLHAMAAPLWPGDVSSLHGLSTMPPARCLALAAAALRPAESAVGGDWHGLARLLGKPLNPAIAARLIDSKGWRDWVAGLAETRDADAVLLPMAALIPASLAVAVEAGLAALPAARRPRTTLLLACLAAFAALPHPKESA